MIFKSILLVGLAATSVEGQLLEFDIVGIKVGTLLPQALDTLKAHNPSLEISPLSIRYEVLPKPLVYAVSALSPAEKIYFMVTMPPGKPYVNKIARSIAFTRESAPNQKVVVDDLISKYGEPAVDSGPSSLNHGGQRELAWHDDSTGRRGNTWPNACTETRAFAIGTTGPSDAELAVPQQLEMHRAIQGIRTTGETARGCIGSRRVRVRLNNARRIGLSAPDLVGMLTVVAGDSTLERKGLEATHDMIVGATQRRGAKEQKDSIKIRPKL